MRSPPVTATYRLQFNKDFTFADAVEIIPYLHALGVSHVYASPFLKARAGSPHGYDIVDHNALNPEIGDAADFARYVETLRAHGMGQILDIVPNHMGVGGDDNGWWLDVLEHGQASRYAGFFDIDWHPVNAALHNKVLIPLLGGHYGEVLEGGELQLVFDPERGGFAVRYYEHLFPIDPRTYPHILALGLDDLTAGAGVGAELVASLESLIRDCRSLPRRTELSLPRRRQRQAGADACKHRLANLCAAHPEIRRHIDQNLDRCNGEPGRPASFDLLHRLLEAQAYRLAYWLVASDEINYRRFFDINDLAGLRMESEEVFQTTHRLLRQLIANGDVDGLRIDHPDGLFDPFDYYTRLRRLVDVARADAADGDTGPFFLLVEKILASYEHLPADWPVDGTTGYEVAHQLNGVLVYSDAERHFNRTYLGFTGRWLDCDELLYQSKKLIIRGALASELTVLANLASAIAQADRHSRDFTYHGLRDALAEVAARFPVYRTYVTRERRSEEDRRYVRWAIAQAKKHSRAADVQVYDFIEGLLTLERLPEYRAKVQRQLVQFALRFQQYTAPVMAKGMEDTAFYAYNRLAALNDVGFDPASFGVSINALHQGNRLRQSHWPRTLVTTSTHDSKRGEDVRARIDVLSELPEAWRRHLSRWGRLNRDKKSWLEEARVPSRNDEYLLYQTVLGTWPLEPPAEIDLPAYRERIQAYMLKALREAKTHTSWVNPAPEYEAAMQRFVAALLDDPERSPFLADFLPFARRVARFGLLNGLSQTLLRLTVPGVPDTYQGNELWAFNLVDPDNRRLVDYPRRERALRGLIDRCEGGARLSGLVRELLNGIEDGRLKLYLTWQTLALRRRHPETFIAGEYLPLATGGRYAEHVCAFARRSADTQVVVAAGRWFARLAGEGDRPPIGPACWNDSWVAVPDDARERSYRDVLTGEVRRPIPGEQGTRFDAADLFAHLPVALLVGEP